MCTYCAQFADPDFAEKFLTSRTAAAAHANFGEDDSPNTSSQRKSSTGGGGSDCVVKSNDLAMQMMAKEMEKNQHIANFEEIKINTEVMLGVF